MEGRNLLLLFKIRKKYHALNFMCSDKKALDDWDDKLRDTIMLALKFHLLDLSKQIFWGWEEYPNLFGIIYYSIDYLSTFKSLKPMIKAVGEWTLFIY